MNWKKLKNKWQTWFKTMMGKTTQVTARLIIVTAPSGAGKTTIVEHLIDTYPDLSFSVSATSRPKREEEIEGTHYYFKTVEEFKQLIREDAFIEWEEVYTNQYYGTLKSEIKRLSAAGKNIIFDIDVQGALSIKEKYPDALAIFVNPPSLEVLIERLKERGSESPESLRKRIEKATYELSFADRFDEVLLNDEKEVALKEAELLYNNFMQKQVLAKGKDE